MMAFKAIAGEFKKAGMETDSPLKEPGWRIAQAIIESKSLSISQGALNKLVPNLEHQQKLLAPNVFAFRDGDLHFESFLAEMYARSKLAAEPIAVAKKPPSRWWWW